MTSFLFRPTRTALLAAAVICAGCTSGASEMTQSQPLTISGELSYRARIALPPHSEALIELRDDTVPAAPVLAEQRFVLDGRQVPIPFELLVEAANLDGRSYALHGGILIDGKPAWTSVTLPVSARPGQLDVGTLMMTPVTVDTPASPCDTVGGCEPVAALQGEEWVVEDIAGGGIIDNSRVTLQFGAAGQLNGRASCNSYHGRYDQTGSNLSVSGIAGTLMACAPALMQQEQNFFGVLRDINRFEFSADGALLLRTADGRSLLARRG